MLHRTRLNGFPANQSVHLSDAQGLKQNAISMSGRSMWFHVSIAACRRPLPSMLEGSG